ncbi:MAG: hypothetical protein II341_09200 [Oscillospiraceae bacterium]|nr:hypothetical protein [Oscillospiraceae bacterium]
MNHPFKVIVCIYDTIFQEKLQGFMKRIQKAAAFAGVGAEHRHKSPSLWEGAGGGQSEKEIQSILHLPSPQKYATIKENYKTGGIP